METLDEHAVRTLLHEAARAPEPPSAVNVDAARRRGSRRARPPRRPARPGGGRAGCRADRPRRPSFRSSGTYGRVSEPPASSPVVNAPWRFNPLVPYASFGWLPPDYSESLANDIDFNQGVTSATDFVSREAAAPAAGRLLYLQVNARDMCAITTAADLQANVRAHRSVQALCTDAAFTVTGAAPDVNGQPGFSGRITARASPGSTRRTRGPSCLCPGSTAPAASPCRRRRRRGRCCRRWPPAWRTATRRRSPSRSGSAGNFRLAGSCGVRGSMCLAAGCSALALQSALASTPQR